MPPFFKRKYSYFHYFSILAQKITFDTQVEKMSDT